MLRRAFRLLNFAEIEALPSGLVRGRSNAVARALAQSDWLLRRKSDGRYLAAVALGDSPRWQPLAPTAAWPNASGAEVARRAFWIDLLRDAASLPAGETLALDTVQQHLDALGIPAEYGAQRGLALVAEPRVLMFAGVDRYRRPLFLRSDAAVAWLRMRAAAAADDVMLEAISGYRSHAYQLGIFARKRARGQGIDEILRVNAAPGYSEHHGGCALDIGAPGEPAAEESFETTAAFAWLQARAGDFGLALSYPRGNPHGIVYEPWHWCWRGAFRI